MNPCPERVGGQLVLCSDYVKVFRRQESNASSRQFTSLSLYGRIGKGESVVALCSLVAGCGGKNGKGRIIEDGPTGSKRCSTVKAMPGIWRTIRSFMRMLLIEIDIGYYI